MTMASGSGGRRDFRPARVRIEAGDRTSEAWRVLALVLFEHLAIVADGEGHHAGFAIRGRPGEQGEAVRHRLALHIVVGATGSRWALRREDAIAVPVIGVTLGRFREVRPQRTFRRALLARPVQAVTLAGRTDQSRCVMWRRTLVVALRGEFPLRVVVRKQRLHHRHLIASHATRQDLVASRAYVERPPFLVVD